MAAQTTTTAQPTEGFEIVLLPTPNAAHSSLVRPPPGSLRPQRPSKDVCLEFKDIKFSVEIKKGMINKETIRKTILNGVSATILPGELLAVMGPSGSGKTSLLDMAADRVGVGSREGDILVNGKPRDSRFRRLAAYVPQDDILFGSLTTKETIMYSARLNMGESFSQEEREARVDNILTELGLQACRDTTVGNAFIRGLSGGQRRRLSLGVELVTEPRLLFLDEVTSGLDSASASSIVGILRNLASKQRVSIMCSIHQPEAEVFFMFTKVLLLSGGRTIYYGPTDNMVPYFEKSGYPCAPLRNPADYYAKIINADFYQGDEKKVALERIEFLIKEYASAYKMKQEQEDTKQIQEVVGADLYTRVERFPARFLTQFWVLLERNLVNTFRNPATFAVRLVLYGLLALVAGTLFLNVGTGPSAIQDRASLLFAGVGYLSLLAVAVIPSFIEERGVLCRERANGAYRVSAYVLATSLAELPVLLIISTVCTALVYPVAGLYPSLDRFGFFILLLFVMIFTADSMMVLISAIVPVFSIALTAGAFVFGYYMATQGFLYSRSRMPRFYVYTGYYWAFHTYAWSALVKNDFQGLVFQTPNYCFLTGCETTGELAMEYLEFTSWSKWGDLLFLTALALGYRVLCYMAIRFFGRGKK